MAAPAPAFAAGDWNRGGIAWVTLEEGLVRARAEGRPVCVVFFTEWCPHCTTYSRVFHDAKVVETASRFVMVLIDRDKSRDVSARYAPDGEYIPRTLFLAPDGRLDESIHAPRPDFRHFFDERSPSSLLAGMEAALKAHSTAPAQSAGGAANEGAPATSSEVAAHEPPPGATPRNQPDDPVPDPRPRGGDSPRQE